MNPTFTADDYLSMAEQLSPAPRILPRLLTLLSDPDSDISDVIELISFDPGVTAKILRTCNSAYYGLANRANDVSEAVSQLGVQRVYEIAAAACGSSTFESAKESNPVSFGLWRHSVTTALAAQLLARDRQLDEGMLFTAALLHDIGKVLLARTWKDQYWTLLEKNRATPSDLIEKQHYSITHAELGGRLLARWQFPPLIATSVWNHSSPIPGTPFDKDTACVTLAEAVADLTITHSSGDHLQITPGQSTALELLEFTPENLNAYIAGTRENFEFVNAMCA